MSEKTTVELVKTADDEYTAVAVPKPKAKNIAKSPKDKRLKNKLTKTALENSIKTRKQNSQKTRDEFLEVLNKRYNINRACQTIGINRSTYQAWLREIPKFKEKVAEIEEARLDVAEESLDTLVALGSESSVHFMLKTKGKERGYTQDPVVNQQTAIVIKWQGEE